MMITVLQMKPITAEPDRNLLRIENAVHAARGFGARLLVTPELSITGYALGADIARLAEPRDGRLVTCLRRLAGDNHIAIVAGFPERDGATLFNSAVLARPDGSAVFYRKCHIYGAEKKLFTASDALPAVFEIDGLKVGMLICYDAEFPEMARGLALAGAELIIVPTALPASSSSRRISQSVLPARALENHVFIAYAGLCGSERKLDYEGGSVILGPDGEDLARAGRDEALLVARIDRDAYDAARTENPYLEDRRDALYAQFKRPPR